MANSIDYGLVTDYNENGYARTVNTTGNSHYVATTGQLYALGTGGTAIGGASQITVTIAGQVFGDYGITTSQVNGVGSSTVSVLDGGIVSGDIIGVRMDGTSNSVTIAGQVSGDTGIETGQANGVGSSTVSVLDGGIVSGTTYGVHMFGTSNTVLNDGTISGYRAIAIEGDYSSIVNTGTILSNFVAVGLTTTGGTTSLVNQGVISSSYYAVNCDGGAADKVVNQGTMTGAIYLADGNDRLVNNGAIANNGAFLNVVGLGEGADTYDGRLGTIEGDVLGQGGNDRLLGGVGAETLDGGTGNDTLKGYGGDDSYLVDSVSDLVNEVGGSGQDLVRSTVSFDLALARGEVEDVELLAGAYALGNGLGNELTGNGLANLLDGRGGADRLTGLAGDDIYVVDNALDLVDEAAGSGTDTIRASITFSLAVSAQVLGLVERIELTGSAAVGATGNANSNLITGNVAANLLTGAGGSDTFRFVTALNTSNADTITDFDVATDRIFLDNAVMAALGVATGALAAAQFWSSAAGLAHDADDRVIYDTDGGFLWYDADGTGAGAALRLANLAAGLALTTADFSII